LLDAFAGLGDRATLHLHGSSFGSPVSEAHFRTLTSQPGHGVVVHGRYDNAHIGENEPLTIQEAQIAGVPVITGNQGGMAELVRDGIDGLHFQLGDARDLRRVLLQLIEDPSPLTRMREQAPAVPSIEGQARIVRQLYLQAITTDLPVA
jgi:glycosyltransferase involved in cell wall biosynthesis